MELTLEEVLSNAVFSSLFKKYLTDNKLVDGKLLSFMQELNEFLEAPSTIDLGAVGRALHAKYLAGEPCVEVGKDVCARTCVLYPVPGTRYYYVVLSTVR